MGMGMGMMPVHGLVALVVATAFLVWIYEKSGNPMQKFGKVIAWIAVIVAIVIMVGQVVMCTKMCASGQCPMMKGKGGMMMQRGMMVPPMGMPNTPDSDSDTE